MRRYAFRFAAESVLMFCDGGDLGPGGSKVMALARFILHRYHGDEEYALSEATITAYRTEDGIRINLDAETQGVALRTLTDTADHPTNPRAEVAFIVESFNASSLVGQRFVVPHGRTTHDDFASLYYYEHEELNNNTVEFLDRRGDTFLVRWASTTRDVNFYDGSKPDTRLEIEGWFRFIDFEKWSGAF